MRIHQWVPAAHRGDAIGDSARQVRGLLRGLGYESDIFALHIDDDLRGDVLPFAAPDATRGDVTIFHFALPSPMTEAFARLDGAKILQYHNITPAAFFAAYDPGLFRLAALGRRELATLAGRVDLALGDSDFNRQELESLGFERTGVMPIAVDTGRITKPRRGPRWSASSATASSTSFSSAASSPTRRSRTTSGSRRCTNATSTVITGSSSSAATTACLAITRRCGR